MLITVRLALNYLIYLIGLHMIAKISLIGKQLINWVNSESQVHNYFNLKNAKIHSLTPATFQPHLESLLANSVDHYKSLPQVSPFQSNSNTSQVKASKPSLFQVTPSVGIVLPQQSIRVQIVTRFPNTPQMVHDISYQNKFMIQYALLERVPASVQDGLRLITEDNKQQKRLFAMAESTKDTILPQSYSGISNKYNYRTVFNDQKDFEQNYIHKNRLQGYGKMKDDQKHQHLSKEIDRLQIEKAHLSASLKPKAQRNLLKLALILVICMLTGYLLSKRVFPTAKHAYKKQKQYRWFGLEKYWSKQQQQANHEWWPFRK